MKTFISGILFTLFVLVVGAIGWIYSGGMPVATSAQPFPLEKKLAHIALQAALRIDDAEAMRSPILADDENLLAGVKIYRANCSVCHGITGQKESAISLGMFPHPPPLMPPSKGVTDDPPGKTFWFVKNGIRTTGMPGFAKSLSEREMWQVTALLTNSDKMPNSVKDALEKPEMTR